MIWIQTTCSDLPFYLVPLSFFPFCSLASEGSLWILTQAVFFFFLYFEVSYSFMSDSLQPHEL